MQELNKEELIKGGLRKYLKDYMNYNLLSQADISQKTGLSKQTVCNVINGKVRPGNKVLKKLSSLENLDLITIAKMRETDLKN